MRNLRPVALAVLALFITAGALAQAKYIPAQQRKGYSELDTLDIKADIAYLASDKLEGRMSLQAGDDAAIQWLVGQFAKTGLDPVAIGASGLPSYLQKFDLIEYRPDREKTSITLLRKGKAVVWHAPQAFGAYKQAVDLTASVVFAGYGITARELDYDDYANIDAKGKIVLVFDHEPQEDDPHSIFNGTGNTRYATSRVKLLNAQAHGAVALIVIPEPNRKHLTNAERAARIGGSLARAVPIPQQAIADDELKIPLITMNDETAKVLLSASAMTGSQLQAAIDKDLFPQSRDLADTRLTIHLVNSTERRATTANVVGLLRGSDNSLSAETVMISAHHDHDGEAPCPAGQGGIDENGQPTPAGKDCVDIWHGADDNASGTAGVLALAKAFQVNKARPARSILFVIFASEERGLLGAFYMAQHPLRPLATTRAVINFDMIGRDEKPSPQTDGLIDIPADTTNRLNLIGAPYSPDYDATVREENQLINLTIDNRFDHDAVLNVLFRSDQFPFLLKNIPAFWWFTGFHPDYHHITDTVEKIDIPKMRKILQLAYLTAWRFGTSQPPAFVANPAPPAAPAVADAGPAGPPPAGVIPVTLGASAPAAAPAPPPTPPAGAEVIELKAAPPAPKPAATAAPVPVTEPVRLKSSVVPVAAPPPPAGTEAVELKAAPPAAKPVPVGPAPVVTPVGLKSSIVPAEAPPPAIVANPDAVALKPAATDAPAAPANAIPLQPATMGAPTGAPVSKPAVTSVTLQPSANPNILAEPAPKTTYTPITLKPDAPPTVAPAKKAAKPAKVSIGSSVSAPVVINSSDGSAPPDTTTPPPHEED